MRFYGITYRDVMALPVRTFWLMDRMLLRIRSEESLHNYRAVSASHGGEGVQEYVEALNASIGKVMVVDPILGADRDEEGFNELRNMATQTLMG